MGNHDACAGGGDGYGHRRLDAGRPMHPALILSICPSACTRAHWKKKGMPAANKPALTRIFSRVFTTLSSQNAANLLHVQDVVEAHLHQRIVHGEAAAFRVDASARPLLIAQLCEKLGKALPAGEQIGIDLARSCSL